MRCRRVFALAVILSLLALPATALAQSASNDQYNDPFGGGGSTTTNGGSSSGGSTSGKGSTSGGSGSSSGSKTSGSSDAAAAQDTTEQGLSQDPQVDPSLTTPPPIDAATTSAGTTSTGKTLPNTGVDLRLLVGAGAALLLIGIGLRLRTADVRRF